MSEFEKIQVLANMEAIIKYNVRKLFNYRKDDFEDLMQEARIIIYNNLDKYDETKASLSTFCQTLIKNNLVLLTKKLYKNWDKVVYNQELIDLLPDNSEDEVKKLFEELYEYVSNNKEKFSKRELLFLELFIMGKSFKEIDDALEITTNNRVQLVFQLKKKLKELLEEVKK